MACGGCTCYFSFWAIFCTFSPLTARKIKMKKKMKKKKKKKLKKKLKKKKKKKRLETSFYTRVPKIITR